MLAQIQHELRNLSIDAVQFLHDHLPEDEKVLNLTSVSVQEGSAVNSVLAVTNERVIFVSPAPQAVAWKLSTITKVQSFSGYFVIEGDAGDYTLGLADEEWGDHFEGLIQEASAVAVIAAR